MQHHRVHSANAQCPVVLAAKSKGSVVAAQRYGSSLAPTECAAEFSGLSLAILPDLSDRWWLQSIAASCNKLRVAPVMAPSCLSLRTLCLAHNCIMHVPTALPASVPNLQVRRSPL